MTSLAAHHPLEAATVHAALWGGWDQLAAVIHDLNPTHFANPDARTVATAIRRAAQVVGGSIDHEDPTTELVAIVVADLEAEGWDRDRIVDALHIADAPGRLAGLPYYLHRLAEDAQRRALLARLVAMADTLERPGGPARVAALLGAGA